MNVSEIQALLPTTRLFERSIQRAGGETYLWAKDAHQHYFLVVYNPMLPPFQRDTFSGEVQDFDMQTAIKWCLPSTGNARKLRRFLSWTAPRPLGHLRSFGSGDLLGLGNTAPIWAARACHVEKSVGLVLAHGDLKTMVGLGRRPDEVLDAATWAIFAEGRREPWGAKAGGLRTEDETRRMAEAGFSWFALDLAESGQPIEPHLIAERAANLARVLDEIKGVGQYDLEISLSDASEPTRAEDHAAIAAELKRRDVPLAAFAPALLIAWGDQGGVEREALAAHLREHFAVAQGFGHKLSLRVDDGTLPVELPGEMNGDSLHIELNDLWWLEASRTLSGTAPALFAEILAFVRDSDGLSNWPATPDETSLENAVVRKALVGALISVLSGKDANGRWLFRDRIYRALLNGEDTYLSHLEASVRYKFDRLGWCS